MQAVEEGGFVRLENARLRLPTYTLPLSKLAHAEHFLSPGQQARGAGVSRLLLAQLATRRQRSLGRYVKRFGTDPLVPFRVQVARPDQDSNPMTPDEVSILLPTLYSRIVESPSLLTGRVTIVGKLVRRVEPGELTYFDAGIAAASERAIRGARRDLRRVLALPRGRKTREIVDASVTVDYPGFVVVPVAIYK